jgi:hypothetical protein
MTANPAAILDSMLVRAACVTSRREVNLAGVLRVGRTGQQREIYNLFYSFEYLNMRNQGHLHELIPLRKIERCPITG